MTESLKHKTLRALSWSFLEAIGMQGLRFIIGLVLARLLLPEQFGLIAMLMIFIAVSQALLDSGFGAALIQKQAATQLDNCSIFYFNIVIGLVVTGLLFLLAPWIAEFYQQPVLTLLTRAISLTIVINSFGLIQNTIFTKQLNFKSLTKVSLIADTLSGIIGVAMAIMGYGVWSLVVQQVSRAFIRMFCLWIFSPWRPALIFSLDALRGMFGFGSRLLLSNLLNQIFDNIYYLVIGKMFSASDLGFFTRAQTLNDLPSQTLSGIVGRVTFPVFSSLQNDIPQLKRGVKKALRVLVLVNFPMMIGLAIIAHPLIVVVLTEKWTPCVPYLQLFCVAGLLFPLHAINLNVLQALGRSDLFLRLEIVKKVLIVINIAVTWRWGLSAMICGIIAISIISYYLNSYYTGHLIDYPILEQSSDLFSSLIMAILMGISIYMVALLPFPNLWSLLFVQVMIGFFVYLFFCRIFRIAAFMEIWQMGWNNIRSNAGNRG